jgi:ATP-dependent metalloprotease FtsH
MLKRWNTWIAERRVGLWFAAALLLGLAALTFTLDQTRPHLSGDPLRYDTFVAHVEAGRVVDARVLNYDSYVVGRYRRPGGGLARYRMAYLKAYGGGGFGAQNDLLALLTTNRVPVTIDQQSGKNVATLLTVVIPALMAIVALLYLIFSWRRGTGLFAITGGGRRVDRDAPRVTFDDVAGQDQAVRELREIADYLAEPERFATIGSTIPRGALLYGAPGSGKTLLARALAGEVGAAFYYVSGAEFVELYAGVGASRVRLLFEEARKHVPAIIFIDELDAIGQRRSVGERADSSDEQEQALNQILTEMDGFEGSEGVIVLAATNRPDVLDPALLRPGRFDRSIGLERTDEAGRLAILRLHARGRPLAADADLADLARRAIGLTGAELANLVNEAGLLAVRAGADEISAVQLDEALERVREAPERQRRLAMRGSAPGRQLLADEKITFSDVAGLDNVIEELLEIEAYLDDPESFARMGARAPRGHLLVGPPGCGKTMLIRALAYEANAAFFWVSASEFTERYVGVGAARVRDLFAEARSMAPSIVFIDEIDSIGTTRGGDDGGSGETSSTLNQILIELDGFSDSEGVVVAAASNRPEILDPALVRPGRFDRTITLDLPHLDARREILKVHAKDKPLSQEIDLNALASETSGFSGADLANLLNEAALLAIRRRKRLITNADVGSAMDRVLLGVAGTQRMTDEQRRIVAYHEAGHAVLGHALPGARVPHRLSVIPRGRTLGSVMTRDDGDRLLTTRSMLLDEMAALLGGHTTEMLVFGDVTSGAAEDLLRVNRIARQMVLELGMSEGLGVVALGDGGGGALREEHSDDTARRIDDEVERLVLEAQARARAVLERSRGVLDRVAAAVVEHELLASEDLLAILDDGAPAGRL